MEPMNSTFPSPGYLDDVRQLTSEKDIILIFDEICTGLRLAPGGAQEYFGVTPDLSVFGKGNWKWIPNRSCSGFGEDNVSEHRCLFFGYFWW